MRPVEEEDSALHIAAACDRAQRARTIEAAVDPGAAMPAERSRPRARIRLTVRAEQGPCSLHGPSLGAAQRARARLLAEQKPRRSECSGASYSFNSNPYRRLPARP